MRHEVQVGAETIFGNPFDRPSNWPSGKGDPAALTRLDEAYIRILQGEAAFSVAGSYSPALDMTLGGRLTATEDREMALENLVRRAGLGERITLVCSCASSMCFGEFLVTELNARAGMAYGRRRRDRFAGDHRRGARLTPQMRAT